MARAYLTLGATPCEEPCQQVGTEGYSRDLDHSETSRYLRQLKRMFPEWREIGCGFSTRTFNHDSGSYREVVINYDDADEKQATFAYHVENNLPCEWDTPTPSAGYAQVRSSALVDWEVAIVPIRECARAEWLGTELIDGCLHNVWKLDDGFIAQVNFEPRLKSE